MSRLKLCAAVFSLPSLLLSANGVVHAQYEPLAFAMCRKIPTDAARLKCFDEIGSTQQKPADTSPQTNSWSITDSKSPIDDTPQVSAILAAEQSGSFLMIRCKEKSTDVIFAADLYIANSEYRVPMLIRLNDSPAFKASWSRSSSSRAAFATNPVEFIKSLPDDGSLFLRMTGYEGKTADGLFKLGNISEVKEKISAACQWSLATPKSDRPAAQKMKP